MRGGITWTNNNTLVSTSYQLRTTPPGSTGSSSSSSTSTSSAVTTTSGTGNGTGGGRGQGTTTVETLPNLLPGPTLSSSSSRTSSSRHSSRSSRTSSTGNTNSQSSQSQSTSTPVDSLPTVVQQSSVSSRVRLDVAGSLLPLATTPNFNQIDPDSSSSSSVSSPVTSSDSSVSSEAASSAQSSLISSTSSSSSSQSSVQSSQSSSAQTIPTPLFTQLQQRVMSTNVVVTVRNAIKAAEQTVKSLFKPGSKSPNVSSAGSTIIPFDAPVPAGLLPWVVAMISLQTILTAVFMYVLHRRVAREVLHRLMRRR
jgi:hypothetical protein